MKSTDYPTPSPACELLRQHLRELWSPIVRAQFDAPPSVMVVTYYTANSLAAALGVSVMTITRAVHRGMIYPNRATSGAMLFTKDDLETLRQHLIKP